MHRWEYKLNTWLWFEVLPDMSPAVPGAPRLVVGAPSYSDGRQECPPRVWYSPEIDTSKFTLHILSDTPGGFQWLKYIVLMLCKAARRLGNGKGVIHRQRVWGSVGAVRAVRNTRMILTETRAAANKLRSYECLNCANPLSKMVWLLMCMLRPKLAGTFGSANWCHYQTVNWNCGALTHWW